jgi:hypothetical protein
MISSCNRVVRFNEREVASIRKRTILSSQEVLGKEAYFEIYQMANDSIDSWIENELQRWRHFGGTTDFQLDSVFCANRAGDRIFFTVLLRHLRDGAVQDGISYFYGVKIRNTWYFFRSAHLVLPREFYQKDRHTPLSFEKLKHIATSNIYRHYLTKNRRGKWEINDNFFRDFTSVAWCVDCVTQEDWDEAYMRQIYENWERGRR